ncbi:hypothetical protein HK102_001543, partial [Quaeritorhiza haematococci]
MKRDRDTDANASLARLEAMMMARLGGDCIDMASSVSKHDDEDFDENDDDLESINSEDDVSDSEGHNYDDGDDDDDDDDDAFDYEEPEVVVFSETGTSSSSSSKKSKADWSAFMSSDINKVAGDERAAKRRKMTAAEKKQEQEDDENDRELMDLLKTSQLIEKYTAEDLTGKERRKYYQQKLIELGGKPAKRPKTSLPIYMGMQKKAKERAEKKLQEAKDSGMYDKSLKHLFQPSDIIKSQQQPDKKRNRGLKTSIGKFKDGVLHISQRDIDAVAKAKSSAGRSSSKVVMGISLG